MIIECDTEKRWEQGMPHHPKSVEIYEFISDIDIHVKDEYLNRPENSVLKSLKSDRPPIDFLEVLLEEEKTNKKRKKVLELINVIKQQSS